MTSQATAGGRDEKWLSESPRLRARALEYTQAGGQAGFRVYMYVEETAGKVNNDGHIAQLIGSAQFRAGLQWKDKDLGVRHVTVLKAELV